ncbi:DNA helicase [Tanacetum coccineum]|uniref:ATP-dependent DNA helicase n=1 Tax=Tanacetum coccineum TaxID=301880 RepID=A0ABQ4ZDJ5_9ASTR
MDVKHRSIRPTIIGFPNITQQRIHGNQESRECSRGHTQFVDTGVPLATNKPTTTDVRKRKVAQPLLTARAEETSFSRNIRRRLTLSSSITQYANKISGDTPSYIDLGNCDQQQNEAFGGLNEGGFNPEIVEGLIHVLDEHNGSVRLFRTARDRYNADERPGFKIRLYSMGGVRGYELPTSDIIGGIVFEDGPRSRTDFDVIIEFIGGPPQRINKLHQSYMSLQFPLFFIFGEPGFYPELTLKPRHGKGKEKKVTMNAYYKYQLHPRVKEFGLIFRGGRLFQQYVVVVFCVIELSRLDFIRKKQNDLRSDYLSGLHDAISRGDCEGIDGGSKIMLPNTFTRGPRYMYSHYLDALAICRSLGNPQFFITFTCNVKWPEIKRYMAQYPELTPPDRADTVSYVLILLYTIEFQKRGLQHYDTLLWVDSKGEFQDVECIDGFISAEIPDPVEDPRGYKLVTELMMHGPCGSANLSVACTEGGICSKNFPKKYNPKTFFDSNGHTQYRRRDTGISVMKGESRLDKCNVVLYNRALCLAFEAHINVEYCGWSMLIKYLFKYISKGPDRILTKISDSEVPASLPGNTKQIDEIQNYVDGRFICPYEACWRIFDFPIHYREPAVQILSVHLENMQQVTFRERDRLDVIVNLPNKKKTTLTKWFLYNNENTDGRHLTYLNFPSEFVCPGELFYFWMLLCLQKGCRSPIELQTVNDQIQPTYQAVCEALGIASLLLPGGRTAHSRFKLPLELTDESLCHAKKSQLGNLLVEADLSIWDEAPMNDRWCFETLDRTLRDLMDAPSLLFGVKTVVLGGDFRQTLPVKKGADKNELIAASIATRSHLWKICQLLLDVGNGEIGEPDEEDGSLQEKAIVCPKNATADAMNAKILSNIEGESRTYLSNDQATPIGRGIKIKQGLLLPNELPGISAVRSINDVLPSRDASMAQKYRRKVDTKNVEGKIIEFTMWDDMEKQFSKEEIQKLPPQSSLLSALAENKIAIPQCAMTNIQLAATPATHYYINPWAPEAEYIYTVFKQKCNLNPPLQVSKYQFKDLKARKNDEHTDFGHAATANPHKLQATESMENRKEASESTGASEFIADDVLDIEPVVQIQTTTRTPSSTSVPALESMEERQETIKGKEKNSTEEGTPPTSYSTVAEHPKKGKELIQHSIYDQPTTYATESTRGYITSLQGIHNVSPIEVFCNEVYGGDSEGFGVNLSSDEFRLCNSDEWRSINGGGPLRIHGYGGGGDRRWIKGVFRSSDPKILTNPSSSPMISMIPTTYATESTRGYITSLQGIRNVSPIEVFGNEVYGGDSEGFGVNPSSDEFRLGNSDEWRSINGGGPLRIRGYGGGDTRWIKGVFRSSDPKILTNPSSSPMISMIVCVGV